MTKKRFEFREINCTAIVPRAYDNKKQQYANLFECISWLNDLHKENEQLKQDNTNLMKLLENQSIIIQKLHSKILEFELKEPKEPIVLTKKDLELMDKVVSYYTHGRYGE